MSMQTLRDARTAWINSSWHDMDYGIELDETELVRHLFNSLPDYYTIEEFDEAMRDYLIDIGFDPIDL